VFKPIAHLVSTRPKLVLIVWAILLIIAAPIASLTPKRLSGNASSVSNSESARVTHLLETQFGQKPVDRTLIVSESSLKPDDAKFLKGYNALVEKLRASEGVNSLTRFDAKNPLKLFGEVDGKYVTATILNTRLEHPEPVLDGIRREANGVNLEGTRFYVTGASAVTQDFIGATEGDVKRSEFSALPLTGAVLIFAFGALVAAGIPLVVGVLSITATMALLFFLTQVMQVSSFAQSVITMLGLGAGIDYALLMVNRFREELARSGDPRQAAAITTRTAGRAVAFSGLTVAIAMAALLIPNLAFVRSMGIGGVLVVLVTVLTSVTAVPASMALLGERVNSPRRLAFKLTSSGTVNPFWGRWAGRVMARPWLAAFVCVGIMLGLAWPALQMKIGYTGAFGLSSNIESRRGLELIRPLELGGSMDTFEVVLDLGTQGFNPESRSNWRKLDAALARWDDVRLVISPFIVSRADIGDGTGGLADLADLTQRSISKDRRYLRLSIIPKEPVHAPAINGWLERLRGAAKDAGFTNILLGGAPVGSKDFTDALVGSMPLAIGVVFAATFVLLGIAFRSLVIPIKSILMNTLTVGAAYGVITLVFQQGFGAAFLNIPTDVGAIDSSLPLVMFAVTFGLSMDYEIFLLSRVQEAHLSGLNTRDSVRSALERTAGVITSAALIMLIVFSAFVQGDVVANKTIGLGLAVAVFLDATLIRLVLVPAVLVLAGEWNWWLPSGLKRALPKVSLEH
jgi:RND superfamily putative drug exporter